MKAHSAIGSIPVNRPSMDFVAEILDGFDGMGADADDYGHPLAVETTASAKQCKSKNLEAERRRRAKIKENLYSLRSLVPKISKMSKESTLTDAIDYIKELEHQIEELTRELLEMPDEEIEQHQSDETMDCKGEVEVSPIGLNKLCVNIVCKKRRAGFTELVEAISNLGLEAISVNFAVLNGVCEIVLCVEAKADHTAVAAAQLRDLLQKVM